MANIIQTNMNFVISDNENHIVMDGGTFKNSLGSNRFTLAPIFNAMRISSGNINHNLFKINTFTKDVKPEKYIIPLGVHNDPHNWGGGTSSNYKNYESLFDLLDIDYLTDLKNEKAILLIDSSFEGYHDDWIFEFFHKECNDRKINPRHIIFVTGNSIVETCYQNWLITNPHPKHIKVVPYSHFEFDTYLLSNDLPPGNENFPPTFDNHVEYKKNNDITAFCNLNKKPRRHRINFYSLLHKNNLLKDGLVSMNNFHESIEFCDYKLTHNETEEVKKTLPSLIYAKSNEIHDPNYYVTRFNDKVCLDTYFSVISEAQYEDTQNTIFLSEKIFKVMMCSHPFMVLGNRNSLTELKKLGYKTFDKWIDESYDTASDCERFEKIIDNLKKIISIEDKLEWFKEMEDVLTHNRNQIKINTTKNISYAFQSVYDHFNKLNTKATLI
tara:strand:- start:50 stop:1369 length:1320 start_codon:yes stop_codon:yes gene_type:complete